MKRLWIDALSLFALFSFAFAQPLFDLLGRHGEFFVAHSARWSDVLLLAAMPSLVAPGVLAALEWTLERIWPRVRHALHLALVGALFGAVVLPPIDRMPLFAGFPAVGLAGFAALVFAWSYRRFEPLRSVTALLSAASLIFPALFLLDDDLQRALVRAPEARPDAISVHAKNPVVVVIFDELPLISLLDRDLEIDARAFPHFADLAQRSYWFRQATAVSPATTVAVPTILNGRFPQPNQLATTADHPETLFQVLAGGHRIRAYETVTRLWPEDAPRGSPRFQGFRVLATDSFVAGLHVWMPSVLHASLPPINLNWGGFALDLGGDKQARARVAARDRRVLMRDFIGGIRKEKTPTFHYLHILLPHFPWEFLPTGRRYGSVSTFSLTGTGIAGICPDQDRWCATQPVVDQNYQRHLLQVGLVDRLLGELVAQLESEGIFDETLLLITADHGVSFRARGMRRAANPDNLSDLLPIPLFLKAPHQKKGATIDRNVEAIDVLPTICDVLDIELPWALDGQSALDDSTPARADKRYYPSPTLPEVVHYSPDAGALAAAVGRKFETFAEGSPDRLAGGEAWLGKRVDEVGIVGPSGLRVAIENESHFDDVDLDADFVPVFVKGRIAGELESEALAIAVSDVLCAHASPYQDASGRRVFFGVVPEACLRSGRNEVAVYAVTGAGAETRLLSAESSDAAYRLVETPAGPTLVDSHGSEFALRRGTGGGRVDSSNTVGDLVEIGGWAADLDQFEPAEQVVVLVDGRSIFADAPYTERPDVAAHASSDRVLESGFLFSFPLSRLADSEVRVFAIYKGERAQELRYHEGYRWRRRSD